MDEEKPIKLLKIREVVKITGLSKSSIYDQMSRDEFPRPISLGPKSVAWLESEVLEWITNRIKKRNEKYPSQQSDDI